MIKIELVMGYMIQLKWSICDGAIIIREQIKTTELKEGAMSIYNQLIFKSHTVLFQLSKNVNNRVGLCKLGSG